MRTCSLPNPCDQFAQRNFHIEWPVVCVRTQRHSISVRSFSDRRVHYLKVGNAFLDAPIASKFRLCNWLLVLQKIKVGEEIDTILCNTRSKDPHTAFLREYIDSGIIDTWCMDELFSHQEATASDVFAAVIRINMSRFSPEVLEILHHRQDIISFLINFVSTLAYCERVQRLFQNRRFLRPCYLKFYFEKVIDLTHRFRIDINVNTLFEFFLALPLVNKDPVQARSQLESAAKTLFNIVVPFSTPHLIQGPYGFDWEFSLEF